eukprot:s7419_g1.t1
MSSSSRGGGSDDFDLDRLIFNARLQGAPHTAPKFPWEVGTMKAIFDGTIVSAPVFGQPRLAHNVVGPIDSEPPAKKTRQDPTYLYESSFSAHGKPDETPLDEEERLWALAIQKWCSIFAMIVGDPGPVALQADRCLLHEGESARDEVVRDVLGLKSPRTAIKRANATPDYGSSHFGSRLKLTAQARKSNKAKPCLLPLCRSPVSSSLGDGCGGD